MLDTPLQEKMDSGASCGNRTAWVILIIDRFAQLKQRYWGHHFWAGGYWVSTMGLNEEMIRKYVKWQIKQNQNMEQLNLFKKEH